MLNIIAAQPLPYIIAVLIGLATAWWIWGGLASAEADHEDADDQWSDADEAMHSGDDTPADNTATQAEAEANADALVHKSDRDRHPPEYSPSKGHANTAASLVAAASTTPSTANEKTVKGEAAIGNDSAAPTETPLSIAPAIGAPDDLKRIKGIGPKLEALLNSFGVKRFDQIAAWTGTDVAEVDAHLQTFRGRITRDEWRVQAGMLSEGHVTEHRNQFGG